MALATSDGTATFEWFVTNPINNYAIALAIGKYDHWSELYQGERGVLTLDYWPLAYHLEAARRQFDHAYFSALLVRSGGSVTEAARELYRTMEREMKFNPRQGTERSR